MRRSASGEALQVALRASRYEGAGRADAGMPSRRSSNPSDSQRALARSSPLVLPCTWSRLATAPSPAAGVSIEGEALASQRAAAASVAAAAAACTGGPVAAVGLSAASQLRSRSSSLTDLSQAAAVAPPNSDPGPAPRPSSNAHARPNPRQAAAEGPPPPRISAQQYRPAAGVRMARLLAEYSPLPCVRTAPPPASLDV